MRISDWSSDVCSSDLIGTDGDWIMDRVGIERRRTVLPLDYIKTTRNADPRQAIEASLYSNAQTGARAAQQAIAAAGISPDEIGLVISGSCSPQSSRSEEHTSELQSLMRISYAVFCLKKKNKQNQPTNAIYRQHNNTQTLNKS